MLKPWREIAQPHQDVLEGTFKQSEFAADISQVASGKASPEYQDAQQFFQRTFITEGMRLLLISVAQRLAGQGGDPVIQLQTAFGGGKTHTMLAVYHLAACTVSANKLDGIPPILDEAQIVSLPQARVAVIDGIRLAPSQPRQYGHLKIKTLWGELAWQLLGEAGYQAVTASDQDGTSPGKEVLIELLQKAAPCVILIDELVAFTRQFEPGQQYPAGTFDSNMSFIQALTEALKAVPTAILLASLPESDLEVGGSMGQRALNALEKYFGRVESIWKPVAAEEAFEIVRRRLFDTTGTQTERDQVCRAFADFYRKNAEKFPLETQENSYFERMQQCYPIHPEIFDRLYEDWSNLEKFQRTRGVLQYLAIVIHRLWNSDNRDPLIMPGALPLDDSNVKNKSLHYLPQGWEPVIEREVDGPRSTPVRIDSTQTLFGGIHAAQRTARTIFLGSAPSTAAQMVRGIKAERILLGAAQPSQALGIYDDVLKRLRDQLHYLYADQHRFWFDTKPNLRREMEGRKQVLDDALQVTPLIKDEIIRAFGRRHCFAGVHVFTPSADIPDEIGSGPRLVVLAPAAPYSRGGDNAAYQAAEEILKNRGAQPRQKQNRLLFLAADYDMVPRLREQAKTYLAWESIVDDIAHEKLNLDLFQVKQAQNEKNNAKKGLAQLVQEAYKWLICPVEEFSRGKLSLYWEAVSVAPAATQWATAVENKLREEEWLIFEWAPIHLRNVLKQWYLKDEQIEVSALKVWQDSCTYLYLPRLLNEQVFKEALAKGVASSDYFGYAAGKEADQYLGFIFGASGSISLDHGSVLIVAETASQYQTRVTPAAAEPETEAHPPQPVSDHPKKEGVVPKNPNKMIEPYDWPIIGPCGGPSDLITSSQPKTRFYGSIALDPIKAKMDFSTVVDEVIQHFSTNPNVKVTISIEVEAESAAGFDEQLQRTVKENTSVLKFKQAEFEE